MHNRTDTGAVTGDEARLYAVLKWRASHSFIGMDAYARAAGFRLVTPLPNPEDSAEHKRRVSNDQRTSRPRKSRP